MPPRTRKAAAAPDTEDRKDDGQAQQDDNEQPREEAVEQVQASGDDRPGRWGGQSGAESGSVDPSTIPALSSQTAAPLAVGLDGVGPG